ncbi:MAG TPA: hypothetical protein VG168_17675 [Bryobacteraceae bacterium]|nr:hypothetical protein [Bryobacteraceae bacterium]
MDTRTKIIPFEILPAHLGSDSPNHSWIVVPGLFDPMTATQVRRLGQYAQGKNLAVVVLDQPGTLLEAASRAVLAAALRIVSVVSIASLDKWNNTNLLCETVPYDEAEERRMTEGFIALVARQKP